MLCYSQSLRNPTQNEGNAFFFNTCLLRSALSSLFQPMGKKESAAGLSMQIFKTTLEWHPSLLFTLDWKELSPMAITSCSRNRKK